MNRFSFELKINQLKFHREVRDYPYYTFATDFMDFVLFNCGLNWIPLEMDQILGIADKTRPRSRSYLPHPQSPCSETVLTAVKKMFISNRRDFTEIYHRLVDESAFKLEIFLDTIKRVSSRLVTEGNSNYETLFRLFYIARLTAVFYEHGTRSAADLAPLIITFTLREKNGANPPAAWFLTLNTAAREIISWYDDGSEIAVDVYLSEVDSDSDSSDSEEYSRASDSEKENADGGEAKDISDKQETEAVKEEEEKPSGAAEEKLCEKLSEGDEKLDLSSDEKYTKNDSSSSDKEF